ncbi:hypothetical protein HK104_007560, partial [Borealophlyctis nickersoniae]
MLCSMLQTHLFQRRFESPTASSPARPTPADPIVKESVEGVTVKVGGGGDQVAKTGDDGASSSGPVSFGLSEVPAAPKYLGFLGLVPFVGTTLAAFHMPEALPLLQELQATYGAIILSFMGAVHWGLAMASVGGTPTTSRYILSTLPAILGFFSISFMQKPPVMLMTQMAGFLALLVGDVVGYQAKFVPA